MQKLEKPDHGGGVDAAARRYGGVPQDWLDLSTGINPHPYPIAEIPAAAWAALPDETAQNALLSAARSFWQVPDDAAIIAANGASALIAMIPLLAPPAGVLIPQPTYNEHGRAFAAAGWQTTTGPAQAQVHVHPNNPTGQLWDGRSRAPLTVIDESFCDVTPSASMVTRAQHPGTIVLKSFGKFWGLAGLRLGFAIGDPDLIARLATLMGPWPVSGAALHIGAAALRDPAWAATTRARLASDAARLDAMIPAPLVGGTDLFRLYDVGDAAKWQDHLAQHHIWSRIFPYSTRWLRLGLPPATGWDRLLTAVQKVPA